MPYTGPYVLTPIPPEVQPFAAQTWEVCELGPGQIPPPFDVMIPREYDARRDELPIQGPSFTARPPERPW